jgi:hypothetical protein
MTGCPMSTDSGPSAVLATLADRLGRDQVFGPPVERGSTTVVPVARVRAGGGRASSGNGAGINARPVGAFSVGPDGYVRWHPAVDVNRIVLGGQLVVGTALALAVLRLGRRRRG